MQLRIFGLVFMILSLKVYP